MQVRLGVATLALVALVAACSPAPSPSAPPTIPGTPDPIAVRITADALAADLDAIAAITREHDGTRATGGGGDAALAGHVRDALEGLGYAVTGHAVAASVFSDPGGSAVHLGVHTAFDGPGDVLSQVFSPAGTAEGPVVALDWDPDARAADGAGCDPADFAEIPPGAIVLTRPAACYRRTVIEHAQAAGAGAVVTAAPWSDTGEIRRSTLIDPGGLTIPALAVSRRVANALAAEAAAGGEVRVTATGTTRREELDSVVAELPGTDPSRVVMVGAHLDSSMDGPGLNDNGSGVAAVLGLARALAGTRPSATIRFAFWAAEETGLHGSAAYVRGLSEAERERIIAYLNADMLGSPNGFAGVYAEEAEVPGSEAIREALVAALEADGVAWVPVDLGGSGDQLPFAQTGIPTGGVYSGAFEPLGEAEAATRGRVPGTIADACYHLACDDRANLDEALLLDLTRALARALVDLAGPS